MPPHTGRRYRFGSFVVDPAEQRLVRGTTELHLRPKTFDVLVLMLDRHPHLVDRQTFFDVVWQGVQVTDDALSRSVKEIRQVLDDDDREPRFIRTVPKRGYAFIHPVEHEAALSTGMLGSARSLVEPTAGDPLPARRSQRTPGIAVLPFADMSAARDQEYFCDGIAEEILTALAQVNGLRVVARTSAFAFKGRAVDVRTIGKTLDVDAILEGSVRRSGDRMRITAQLVSAADGNQLWAGRYDRPAEELFGIQDDIASTIAQQLRNHLALESLAGVVRTRRANLEAHHLFLKGRYFLNRRHPGDHQRAITCFDEALARDPGHAPSAVAIGDAFIVLGTWGLVPPDAVLSNARAAIERALTIDDTLADGHLALAFIAMWYRRDRRMAEREFHRGFELGLRHPVAHEWYASYLLDQGRDAEALAQAHQGLLMDPLSPTVHTVASVVHLTVGRIEEAQAMLRHALELDQGLPTAHHLLGWSWLAAGRDDLAEPLLRRGAEAGFTNSMALLAVMHARVGQSKRAVAVLDDFDQRAASRWIPSFDRAIVHAALGDEAQSFALVDEALARGEPVRIMTLGQFMSGLLPDAWLSEVKRRASAPMPEMPGRVPT